MSASRLLLEHLGKQILTIHSRTCCLWTNSAVLKPKAAFWQGQCFPWRGIGCSPAAADLPPAALVRLEQIQARSRHLNELLQSEAAAGLHHKEQADLAREVAELEGTVEKLGRLNEAQASLQDLYKMKSEAGTDQEMQSLILSEIEQAKQEVPQLEEAILMELLPKDELDTRAVILEVRAGTGGDEASLFAEELFNMYARFAQAQKWHFELVEKVQAGGTHGVKLAIASVQGHGIFGQLKHESGVHRVQRIPKTESQGRVHTSAASVAILPQAEEVDVDLNMDEVRIDTYRSSGAGGQHVNTTDSAVRVVHIPTGVTVAIQDERSQHKNKAKALGLLRARLFDQKRQEQHKMFSKDRKIQIGSGDRSERIRTYNFPQGRITDHRVGLTQHNIDGFMTGSGLREFIDALQIHFKMDLLSQLYTH